MSLTEPEVREIIRNELESTPVYVSVSDRRPSGVEGGQGELRVIAVDDWVYLAVKANKRWHLSYPFTAQTK